MLTAKEILNTYFQEAETELYPDFYDRDDYESELIPGYENDYTIYGIYIPKPEYEDLLADYGYSEVYEILGHYSEPFIGMMIGKQLMDVTDEIAELVNLQVDRDEDWNPQAMLRHGAELYDAYGPDVDILDMTYYDGECYRDYLRSIGK